MKIGVVIFVLALVYLAAAVVVPRVFVALTKVGPGTKVSLVDSRVLADKLLAKADGIDQCKINVFVLDQNGRGVVGKAVSLTGLETIEPSSATTDTQGRVTFTVTSKVEGQFGLVAEVEGSPMPTEIKATFRN